MFLVAPGDGDEAVVPLAAGHGLDGVRDEVAGLERERHPLGAHGHAVRDPDGVESHPLHTGRLDPFLHRVGEPEQVHVAVVALVPDAGDADLRLVEVRLGEPGGEELGLRGSLGFRLGDARAPTVDLSCHDVLRFLSIERADCSGWILKRASGAVGSAGPLHATHRPGPSGFEACEKRLVDSRSPPSRGEASREQCHWRLCRHPRESLPRSGNLPPLSRKEQPVRCQESTSYRFFHTSGNDSPHGACPKALFRHSREGGNPRLWAIGIALRTLHL